MVPRIMLKENFSTLKMISLQKKSSHGIDTMIKFWCIFQRNFALYIESNYLSYFLLFYTTIYPNGLCTRGLMAKCNISLTGKFFWQKFYRNIRWKLLEKNDSKKIFCIFARKLGAFLTEYLEMKTSDAFFIYLIWSWSLWRYILRLVNI